MWTVIYMAQIKERAKKLGELLKENNIIIKIRCVHCDSDGSGCYELLVPAAEFNAAQDLMFESGLF